VIPLIGNTVKTGCLFLLQAVRVLSTLLSAVHVSVVGSAASTSDFSLASSPRKPQTAEPTPAQDDSMYAKYHTAISASASSVGVTDKRFCKLFFLLLMYLSFETFNLVLPLVSSLIRLRPWRYINLFTYLLTFFCKDPNTFVNVNTVTMTVIAW